LAFSPLRYGYQGNARFILCTYYDYYTSLHVLFELATTWQSERCGEEEDLLALFGIVTHYYAD
jgi:hypothetical protein